MEICECSFFLAYTGPGLGAGVVALVIGVITSIFLALFAIIWYPLKRLFKRMRSNKATEEKGARSLGVPVEGP